MPDPSERPNTQARSSLGRLLITRNNLSLAAVCAIVAYQGAYIVSFDAASRLAARVGLELTLDSMPWFVAAIGAAAGLLLGAISELFENPERAKRLQQKQQAAAKLGARFVPGDSPVLAGKLGGHFRGGHLLRARDVLDMKIGGLRLEVAVVSFPGSNDGTVEEVAALYEPPELLFPEFLLQPEGRFTDFALGIDADIDFPGQPEFSAACHLWGERPDLVRKLFDDGLLELLGRRRGLTLRSAPGALLLTTPGAPDLEIFSRNAAEIFAQFDRAARRAGMTVGMPQPPLPTPAKYVRGKRGFLEKTAPENPETDP